MALNGLIKEDVGRFFLPRRGYTDSAGVGAEPYTRLRGTGRRRNHAQQLSHSVQAQVFQRCRGF
jgi:hypothetical protein